MFFEESRFEPAPMAGLYETQQYDENLTSFLEAAKQFFIEKVEMGTQLGGMSEARERIDFMAVHAGTRYVIDENIKNAVDRIYTIAIAYELSRGASANSKISTDTATGGKKIADEAKDLKEAMDLIKKLNDLLEISAKQRHYDWPTR